MLLWPIYGLRPRYSLCHDDVIIVGTGLSLD